MSRSLALVICRGLALILIFLAYAVQHAATESDIACATTVDSASSTVAIAGEALLQTKHTVAKPEDHAAHGTQVWNGGPSQRNADAHHHPRPNPSDSAHLSNLQVRGHRQNTSTFFYHYHMPRTGGTTVANLMLAHICRPFEEQLPALGWADRCTQTCELGLVENEFVCPVVQDERAEHQSLQLELPRVLNLALQAGASNTLIITTLRRGSTRFISEWLKNVRNPIQPFLPPPGAAPESNESLVSFINNSIYGPSCGPNLQVSYLASVPRPFRFTTVTTENLHHAQQALLTGRWLIGFSECMEQMNAKLSLLSSSLYGVSVPKLAPRVSQSVPWKDISEVSEVDLIELDPKTKETLEAYSEYDNELYEWAWGLARAGADDRFAGTC